MLLVGTVYGHPKWTKNHEFLKPCLVRDFAISRHLSESQILALATLKGQQYGDIGFVSHCL